MTTCFAAFSSRGEALARQLAQAYACVEYVSCSECYGGSG